MPPVSSPYSAAYDMSFRHESFIEATLSNRYSYAYSFVVEGFYHIMKYKHAATHELPYKQLYRFIELYRAFNLCSGN